MTYATGCFSFTSLLCLNSKKWLVFVVTCAKGSTNSFQVTIRSFFMVSNITNIHSVNVGKGVDTCNNSALGGTNATTVTKECRSFDVRSFGVVYTKKIHVVGKGIPAGDASAIIR